LLMAPQGAELAAGRRVPEPRRVIPTACHQESAVGAERDAHDLSGMPARGEQDLAGGDVPDLDLARYLTAGLAREGVQGPASLQVPELDRAGCVGSPDALAHRGETAAVRAESHIVDWSLVPI